MEFKKEQKGGFTLAEVLITLAIIGVVAALTIPAIVMNYKKTQTVTKLKKVYSALSNTTNLAIAEHGPIQGWDYGTPRDLEDTENFVNKYLIPYLKVSKDCGNKTTGECRFQRKTLSKASDINFPSTYSRFYLNDGTLVGITLMSNDDNPESPLIARLVVDINGQKEPNTLGKDIFAFNYQIRNYATPSSNGKFAPVGSLSSSRSSLTSGDDGCHKAGTGYTCTGLIMKDGWEIKDDYPW